MVTGGTAATSTTTVSMATSTIIPIRAASAKPSMMPREQAKSSTKLQLPILIRCSGSESAHPEHTTREALKSPDVNTPETDSTPFPSITFVPESCLFCSQTSCNFDANLTHMQKSHGLFIPTSIDDGDLHLAVDAETLVEYMHLVIFGYHECLFCGTERADGWATRQHMMGKGHCRIDLAGSESEWRDFYESHDSLVSEDEDEGLNEGDKASRSFDRNQVHVREEDQPPSEVDGNSLRLSSGKIVAHRAAPAPKDPYRKPLTGEKSNRSRRGINHLVLEDFLPIPEQPSRSATDLRDDVPDSSATTRTATNASPSTPPPQAQALSRADRRLLDANKSAVTAAVATMSKRDRAALAHLSPAERRSMVLGQFKQQQRVHIAKRKYWSKFERRQDQPAEGGKVYIGGG